MGPGEIVVKKLWMWIAEVVVGKREEGVMGVQ